MRYYTPSVTPNLKKHSDPYSYVLMFCDKMLKCSVLLRNYCHGKCDLKFFVYTIHVAY